MKGRLAVNTSKCFSLGTTFSFVIIFVIIAASHAHADVVNYRLEDVILEDGQRITGTFDWTFNADDFAGGSGAFTALKIPYTSVYNFADGNLSIDIQSDSIEISGNGNYHDYGLDIQLKFPAQPFTPTQSTSIDLDLSWFECCGNGFKDQGFVSGSIVPTLPGDFDGDTSLTPADVPLLVQALVDRAAYDAAFPLLDADVIGDVNEDGAFNLGDVKDFNALFAPVGAAEQIPEPTSIALATFFFLAMIVPIRRR